MTHNLKETTTTRKPRYFYGWNIVVASFLAGLSYAEHFTTILGLFIRPIQREFGWSRSSIAGVSTLGRLIEALIAPFMGSRIDRYGPRLLMPVGAIIVCLAMIGASRLSTLFEFYLFRGVIVSIGFSLMGHLVTSVTINKWFIRKRGRALAISQISHNISNILMTPLSVFIIVSYGWRAMFIVFALVTFLVVPIPSAVLMRRCPEDLGMHPDGIDPGAPDTGGPQLKPSVSGTPTTPEPVWKRREVLMTPTFWLLTACFAINNVAFQGINMSLAPYIQDLGHNDAMLAAVVTFRSVTIAASTLMMGFIVDRAYTKTIRILPFIIQAIGVFFFLLGQEPLFLWLGVAMYAFGMAGIRLTQEIAWVKAFGRFNLGLVRSLGFSLTFGFGAVGPIAINAVFDIFGSYQIAFFTIIGLLCLAGLLMGTVQPPKAKRYADTYNNGDSPRY